MHFVLIPIDIHSLLDPLHPSSSESPCVKAIGLESLSQAPGCLVQGGIPSLASIPGEVCPGEVGVALTKSECYNPNLANT